MVGRPVRRLLQYPRQGLPQKWGREVDLRSLMGVGLVDLAAAWTWLREQSKLPYNPAWLVSGKGGAASFGSGAKRNGLWPCPPRTRGVVGPLLSSRLSITQAWSSQGGESGGLCIKILMEIISKLCEKERGREGKERRAMGTKEPKTEQGEGWDSLENRGGGGFREAEGRGQELPAPEKSRRNEQKSGRAVARVRSVKAVIYTKDCYDKLCSPKTLSHFS